MGQGKLLKEQSVASRYLGTNRVVRVYLPPSYDREPKRRYPVLYVHDGQNVFSSAVSHCCFGWGGWDLDETVDRLCATRQMQEIIMVAIDNSAARYREYRGPAYAPATRGPARPGRTPPDKVDNSQFEAYANFLCRELKAQIDREYRTMPKAACTGMLGASLGGICSLALAWNHPRTFGGAASLSGSFQIEKRHFLESVLRRYQARRKPLRLYLDSGVTDSSGDDDGRRNTEAVAGELRRIGWKDGVNLRHFVDERLLGDEELERAGLPRHKWEEARHSQHNELYWRLRVWRALVFLFPPDSRG